MLNIHLSDPNIFEALNGNPPPPVPAPYQFIYPHLVDIGVKVKHMHLVSSCEGESALQKFHT